MKLEVWTIIHCLGLGHETMICAVCLFIFLQGEPYLHIDGLVQERRNPSVLEMELRLSYANPSICGVECKFRCNYELESRCIAIWI